MPVLGKRSSERHSVEYSKMMFLVLNQVYYWGFKSNAHNNYNYIIKTKWNYFNYIVKRCFSFKIKFITEDSKAIHTIITII